MLDKIVMIMPMAGRGERFARQGEVLPKPLIKIVGMPFFYWATLSVLRELPDIQLVYIVLREHVDRFSIDLRIKELFPKAIVIIIPSVTSGSLATALKAELYVEPDAAVIINDCDHAFSFSNLDVACNSLKNGANGFLSHFHSENSNFSYAEYTSDGVLLRTAEKNVISDLAIAGVYGFKSFRELKFFSERYLKNCPYLEFFVSGVFNEMLTSSAVIGGYMLDFHISFGTPNEYQAALEYSLQIKSLENDR